MSAKLRKDTGKYEVRWREGSRQRSRSFDRKRDADTFDLEQRRNRMMGVSLATLDAGRQRLEDFVIEWHAAHALPNLEASTRKSYAAVWDLHVLPRLGTLPLRDITPEVVGRLRADLHKNGVGDPTILKALAVLQSVLALAVTWGRIPANPVASVRKPAAKRSRQVQPLAPATVEHVRDQLKPRDATLVSVLAYAGLRPEEALALRWSDVRARTLLVERAVQLGEHKTTKTRRARTVRLLAPLAQDLAEWRMASGRPDNKALVFPRPDGDVWRDTDWRNWRTRVFQATTDRMLGRPSPADARKDPEKRAARQTIAGMVPYDLRHSFVSLLLHEGRSLAYVAEQAGHSVDMCARTYSHVMHELEDAPRQPADDLIRQARQSLVEAAG